MIFDIIPLIYDIIIGSSIGALYSTWKLQLTILFTVCFEEFIRLFFFAQKIISIKKESDFPQSVLPKIHTSVQQTNRIFPCFQIMVLIC